MSRPFPFQLSIFRINDQVPSSYYHEASQILYIELLAGLITLQSVVFRPGLTWFVFNFNAPYSIVDLLRFQVRQSKLRNRLQIFLNTECHRLKD
jgi:hypothetical protein